MLTPNEPDEAQLAGVDVRQQPQLLQNPAAAASSPKLSTGSALTTQTSRQWSSHSCLADHKEIQATAMAVDSRGEVAVLGARKMLAVVPIRRENRNLGTYIHQTFRHYPHATFLAHVVLSF